MPAPFGFSIGDFIAGINLLVDVIKSLSDAHGAPAEYREIQRELVNLAAAFNSIQDVLPQITQNSHISTVYIVLNDCRSCIDSFVQRNCKFKSLKSAPGKQWSFETFRKRVHSIQWALWKKGDVVKIRDELRLHLNAVQMLLATIQVKQMSQQEKQHVLLEQRNDECKVLTEQVFEQHANLVHTATTAYGNIEEKLRTSLEYQEHTNIAQSKLLLQTHMSYDKIRTQMDTMQMLEQSMTTGSTPFQQQLFNLLNQSLENQRNLLSQLQNLQAIPPQIMLSKPVTLLDALGRSSPFHIDFIDSAEALIAVLKIRFKDLGLHKIERNEFTLEDSRSKRPLQLYRPWTSLVRPGQYISMSMLYRLNEAPTTRCPACGNFNEGSNTDEIICSKTTCQMTYRRIVEIESEEIDISSRDQIEKPVMQDTKGKRRKSTSRTTFVEDDLDQYARVQILVRGEHKDDQDHSNIVTPPKGVKGILKKPSLKFPEEPFPIREGVAPLQPGEDIPVDARWTRISRRLVNPESLEEEGLRFEEYPDYLIVLQVLRQDQINALAARTGDIRVKRGAQLNAQLVVGTSNEMASVNDYESPMEDEGEDDDDDEEEGEEEGEDKL